MDALFDDAAPGGNLPEISVSELSGAIKRTLEGSFSRVRVRAEVGRVMVARTGHVYFDLKDERAVISSVAWKGVAARLAIQPEEGMEVIASGKISTFGPQSKYQLVVDALEPAGVGALMAMLEKRKKELAAEGLFAPERKKPIPYLPEVIGVVTSPSGAVIRDILHRLRDRFPRKVLIWPVTVQGKASAGEVTAAIEGFNRLTPGGPLPRPDLLIVARGGGSLEDLWGFNEENVVRAAAASDIPLISAVGHETDTTLIDFAADLRAPTPTAAAEKAVPVRADLMAALADLEARRVRGAVQGITRRRERLRDLARALPRPATLTFEAVQRLDAASARLPQALLGLTRQARAGLAQQAGRFGPNVLRASLSLRAQRLGQLGGQVNAALTNHLIQRRTSAGGLVSRLRPQMLARATVQGRIDLSRQGRNFRQAARRQVAEHSQRLDALERLRITLGYQATLARGYAVARDANGAVVTDLAAAKKSGVHEIEFRDGRHRLGDAKPARRAASRAKGKSQGELF